MLRNRHRKTLLASASLVAATALLGACQDGGDSSADDSTSDSSASSGKDGSANSGDGGGGEENDTGGGSEDAPDHGADPEGTSGTWFGTVSYVASGKYSVSDMKGTKQVFMTSTDTKITGVGEICAAGETCSESDLEAAAKEGVSAKVKLKDGSAVSIKED
ncbi:hypothetical protein [Streptomyces oceani]|uniref:hypothetical protein n=1 Tax=Streptomyces oceani TaxID=1075402 RepID=UPI000872B67A|nr:hypothetical protein [Streptomyces oceani]